MLLHKVVACRVKEHGEAPRIPECDEMRFSGEEFGIEHFEQRNLVARGV